MPFYTYKCPRCGAEREEMREMDDRNRDLPLCYNGDVPCEMELVTNPVAGIVKNPAAGPRRVTVPAKRSPAAGPRRSK